MGDFKRAINVKVADSYTDQSQTNRLYNQLIRINVLIKAPVSNAFWP